MFWLFNVFKAIKWVKMALKNYIYGLKSYVSSKPICFFWLIHRVMVEYIIT